MKIGTPLSPTALRVMLRGPQDVQSAWDHAASSGRVDQGRVIVEGLCAISTTKSPS